MKKLIIICFAPLILLSCRNKDRDITVELKFVGQGKFKICFKEQGKELNDWSDLHYHLFAETKNDLKLERESLIVSHCEENNFIQLKLGAYSQSELDEMETQFVPGNIKNAKVEIYYGTEYNSPFIIQEFTNL